MIPPGDGALQVLRQAHQRLTAGERPVLATVVATRGSTPQKVGARMLVVGGERAAGTLGGGAVEAEAVRDAGLVLGQAAAAVHEYDLSTSTDEWGLACGGTMVIHLAPLVAADLAWLTAVVEAGSGGGAVALVSVLDGPRAGTRRLVRDPAEGEGPSAGECGAVEPGLVELGRRALAGAAGELTQLESGRVYAEVFAPAPGLVVAGAGHVGKALARLGRFLELRVTVLDDRPEYATRARFPEAEEVVAGPVPEGLAGLRLRPDTAVVVTMRTQDLDYEATLAALRTPARYVGLLGARRKTALIVERLLAAGLPAERVRELRSPIGLDIGARSPEEIAVSVLGEWIMLRQGGGGAPLRLADELVRQTAARAGG
jgi:xanthine dehydrogenase accessory factor